MKSRKLPYFQFYADDYLSSPGVTTCDLVDEGIYIRLLAYSWKHQGCQLPHDMKYLRKLCKSAMAARISAVIERHFEIFEVSPGFEVIRNSRLYTEFCKACGIGSARSQAAKCRWNKEKQDASASVLHMQTGMQNDAIPDVRYQIPEEPTPSTPKKPAAYPEWFEAWWQVYPARNGKKAGKRSAYDLCRHLSEADVDLLLIATANYAACTENAYAKDPERFLKKDYWRDMITAPEGSPPSTTATAVPAYKRGGGK